MQDSFSGLNEQQRRAVEHGDGPLLVVAGAGTGKTLTLACRVARLIQSGVDPERILLLTFARRAAREMLARVGGMVGDEAASRVWGGTFHAMAHRLLRQYGAMVGLAPEFLVMDQADAADLLHLLRMDLGLAEGERRFPQKDTLIEMYSRVVNTRTALRDVLAADFPWCAEEVEGLKRLFAAYLERKRGQGLLDYDDLLLYAHGLATQEPSGKKVAGLWDHILVDEYQDVNLVQADLLAALRQSNPNLTVVGDDAQAIYAFRSADVRNILDFPNRFPGTTIVTLEQNYRSTMPVLGVSNAVMAEAGNRYEKALWSARASGPRPALAQCLDEGQQAAVVADRALELREQGVALREQAVLYRSGHHSDLLQVELARRNIPFVVFGGLRFLEAAHVKDILAFLRILENAWDQVSWFRALQLLPGVGPGHARAILAELGVRAIEGSSEPRRPSGLMSPLQRLSRSAPMVPPEAVESMAGLRLALTGAPAQPPAVELERLRAFYAPLCERKYRHAAARLRDLEQLEHLASRYSTRSTFITDLTLDPPASTSDLAGPPLLDDDYLTLSTIHSAKGCEWKAVHVIYVSDGNIPSDLATRSQAEIDEERRLLYVALTRAKDVLWLYWPLRYYHRRSGRGDAHSFAQVSRFLTPAVRLHLEQRALYDERQGQVVPSEPAGAPAAVTQALSHLFD